MIQNSDFRMPAYLEDLACLEASFCSWHASLQRSLCFVLDVINNLNRSRSEIDKASPLLLQSFDFSTLYTKIDLVDLKARMRVLINKVFNRMLKLRRFKFFDGSKNSFEL
jgi:hypothetical protein